MPTRLERWLKRAAGLAALLALAGLGAAVAAPPGERLAWPGLVALYATGVAYGLAEMVRLNQRHRRRCPTCLRGAGPHLRWWAPRVVLVLLVSVLPVLLILPVVTGTGTGPPR